MAESESFSSLMDLVNSHLSKTSLNTSQSNESSPAFPLATVRIQTGMSQTVFTPPNGIMAIPRLTQQDNEITNVLAQQVTNMLIAKEKKKQEDEKRQRLEEEIKILKHQRQIENYDIDLMSSIITNQPTVDKKITKPLPIAETISPSSAFDSLLAEVKALGENETAKSLEKGFDALPLSCDMSYMLFTKVRKNRPSPFGKVISARVKPVAAPYLKVKVNSVVKQFDFSKQSPCDINLEKRRHPPQDPLAHMNMVERFMAQTNNDSLHPL